MAIEFRVWGGKVWAFIMDYVKVSSGLLRGCSCRALAGLKLLPLLAGDESSPEPRIVQTNNMGEARNLENWIPQNLNIPKSVPPLPERCLYQRQQYAGAA